jgi:predicted nucleic-acid-binding Zn-ribbon protein
MIRTEGQPQTEQQKIDDVVAELRNRGLYNDTCPRCRRSTNWATDFFQMPVAPSTTGMGLAVFPQLNAFIPIVSFTCTNCGYMMNHNLRILGKEK